VLLIVTAIAISVNSIPPSLANHGDEGISNYIWSRANSDGHRSLLNCEDPPNADRCDIEYDIASNIANIAGHLTATQISNEAANAESNVNSFNVYIDVKETSSSPYDITPSNLGIGSTATYTYDRHCTEYFLWWCTSHDSHFIDFDIKINTYSYFDFATYEACSGELPTKWDLEKVLGHEFFHMFGVDHDSSANSITYGGGYVCGQGEVPTAHDRSVVNDKYVGGVT